MDDNSNTSAPHGFSEAIALFALIAAESVALNASERRTLVAGESGRIAPNLVFTIVATFTLFIFLRLMHTADPKKGNRHYFDKESVAVMRLLFAFALFIAIPVGWAGWTGNLIDQRKPRLTATLPVLEAEYRKVQIEGIGSQHGCFIKSGFDANDFAPDSSIPSRLVVRFNLRHDIASKWQVWTTEFYHVLGTERTPIEATLRTEQVVAGEVQSTYEYSVNILDPSGRFDIDCELIPSKTIADQEAVKKDATKLANDIKSGKDDVFTVTATER